MKVGDGCPKISEVLVGSTISTCWGLSEGSGTVNGRVWWPCHHAPSSLEQRRSPSYRCHGETVKPPACPSGGDRVRSVWPRPQGDPCAPQQCVCGGGRASAARTQNRVLFPEVSFVKKKKKKCRIKKLDGKNTPMVSGRSCRFLFYPTLPLIWERSFLCWEKRQEFHPLMSRTSLPFTLDVARWQLVQGEALRAGLGPGLSTWWSGAGYPSLEGTGGQGLPGRARRGRLLQRALANRGALGAPRLGQVSPRPTSTVRTALWCTLSRWGPDWSLTPGAEIPAPAQLPCAKTAGGVSCGCPPPGWALSPGPGPPPPPLGSHPGGGGG